MSERKWTLAEIEQVFMERVEENDEQPFWSDFEYGLNDLPEFKIKDFDEVSCMKTFAEHFPSHHKSIIARGIWLAGARWQFYRAGKGVK